MHCNPLQSYFIKAFIGFYNEVFRQLTRQVVKHHVFVNNKTLNQSIELMNSVSELSLSTTEHEAQIESVPFALTIL